MNQELKPGYLEALEALRNNPSMKIVVEQWKDELVQMGLRMMLVAPADFAHWQGRMVALNEVIALFCQQGGELKKINPETGRQAPPGFF